MTVEEFLRQLCLEAASPVLAIDLLRAMHAGAPELVAEATKTAPTSVAVVPLQGGLYPSKLHDFAARITHAAGNADVGHIVIPVDSPGGSYNGTPEAAAAVAAARQVKPVTAHIGSLGASAAYWIASQAHHVHANPSADIGSIGVMALHMDHSAALEQMGMKPTIIRSTAHKADINSLEPLTEEARAHIQGQVDDAHGEFIRAVAAGRRVAQAKVESDFGRGRVMSAGKALDAGMIDKISTLSDTLAGARSRVAALSRRRSAALL